LPKDFKVNFLERKKTSMPWRGPDFWDFDHSKGDPLTRLLIGSPTSGRTRFGGSFISTGKRGSGMGDEDLKA